MCLKASGALFFIKKKKKAERRVFVREAPNTDVFPLAAVAAQTQVGVKLSQVNMVQRYADAALVM